MMHSFIFLVGVSACLLHGSLAEHEPELADLPKVLRRTNPRVVGRSQLSGEFIPRDAELANMLTQLDNSLLRRAAHAKETVIKDIKRRSSSLRDATDFDVKAHFLILRSTSTTRFKEKMGMVSLAIFKVIITRLELNGAKAAWFKKLITRKLVIAKERKIIEYIQRVVFTLLGDECLDDLVQVCERNSRFRTFDGSCNNLVFGQEGLGKAGAQLRRVITDDAFEDDAMTPRGGNTGGTDFGSTLPNARKVSTTFHPTSSSRDNLRTHLVMQMGEFIDHDFALTPMEAAFTATGQVMDQRPCCEEDVVPAKSSTDAYEVPDRCFTINFEEDALLPGRTCMNFVRSSVSQNTRCFPQGRQQLSAITHFLDGSLIYGSSQAESDRVRKPVIPIPRAFHRQRGDTFLLNSQYFEGQELLPPANVEEVTIDGCPKDSFDEEFPCFDAGDNRANEQPVLSAVHSLFVRDHNRVALDMLGRLPRYLHSLRSSYAPNAARKFDDAYYLEVRRLMVAQLQHILYNEFFRAILGDDILRSSELEPLKKGFFYGYSDETDPSITSEFVTAAFRMGHTLIRDNFTRWGENGERLADFKLEMGYFTPEIVYGSGNGGTDALLRGLVRDPEESYDSMVTDQVRHNLFINTFPNMAARLDLPSLNIQRGRDHGIPGYFTYRRHFGLSADFSDIPDDQAARYEDLYTNGGEDVDLWSAGVSERSVDGGMLGPVFQRLFVDQLRALKFGDRFYYENGNQAGSFTKGQLNEIRKASMSYLYCCNVKIHEIQRDAFMVAHPVNNPVLPCSQIIAEGPDYTNFFYL